MTTDYDRIDDSLGHPLQDPWAWACAHFGLTIEQRKGAINRNNRRVRLGIVWLCFPSTMKGRAEASPTAADGRGMARRRTNSFGSTEASPNIALASINEEAPLDSVGAPTCFLGQEEDDDELSVVSGAR